ncbi:MAG: hypothetical protein Q9217_006672 [Psora testacea]
MLRTTALYLLIFYMCDGVEPNACSKCVQRKIACIWEPHTKESKDDLIQQIVQLKNRNKDMTEATNKSEEEKRDFQQTSEWQGIILQTIGQNGHDRQIIKRLREGQSYQAIADWLVEENPDYRGLNFEPAARHTLTDVVKTFEAQCQGHDGLQRRGESTSTGTPWIEVSKDNRLIGHLFDLYFTWVHPVHMLFSELDFKRDFREATAKADTTYCSSSLVNAICAMGCHLLESEKVEEEGPLLDLRRGLNAATLREGFMDQAKKALIPEIYSELTSTQTFAVMYLVEFSSGKARIALGYLRLAAEGLQSSSGGQSEEAFDMTFWGIKTLITSCVGTTYQKLYAPVPTSDTPFKHVKLDRDKDVWRFYRQPGDEREMPTRPSFAIVTACHQANLFRFADQAMRFYCGARGKVTAGVVVDLYRKFQEWKENLPERLQVETQSNNPLPHVLYLHIQLHTVFVQFLNPLAQSDLFADAQWQEIRDMIVTHAKRGLGHFQRAIRLYTARFHIPLLSFCCVHLADAIFVYEPETGPDVLEFALTMFQQTRTGFALCGPLQQLLRQRAEKFNIQIPEKVEPLLGSISHFSMDEILDACTRLAYTQPLEQILGSLDPNISKDWPEGGPSAHERSHSSGGDRMQIDMLLNDS